MKERNKAVIITIILSAALLAESIIIGCMFVSREKATKEAGTMSALDKFGGL